MNATCDNCGREWPQEKLTLINDLLQRVLPGELMPFGECPACGALCHGEQYAVAHRQYEHGALALFFFSSKEKAWRYAAKIVADELSIWGDSVESIASAIVEGHYEKAIELWHTLPGNNDSIDLQQIQFDLFHSDDEIVLPRFIG